MCESHVAALPLTERVVEDRRVVFALAQQVLEDVVDVDVGVVYLQRIEGGLRRGCVFGAQFTKRVGKTLHVLTWTCVPSCDGGHQFPDQALVVPLVRGEDIGGGGQLIGPGPGVLSANARVEPVEHLWSARYAARAARY